MDESGLMLVLLLFLAAVLIIAFQMREREQKSSDKQKKIEQDVKAGPQVEPTKSKIELHKSARVEHIIDGDTVILSSSFRKFKVRLDSIDCPEDGQDWGDTAKYGLIKLIGGKKVHFEDHGQDAYGRTLATLYVRDKKTADWVNVNERMVTLGHAWVMRRFYNHLPKHRQTKLNQLERWAKSKKVGLWGSANPLPPWKYRGENGKI